MSSKNAPDLVQTRRMDDLTATAFAFEEFERRHPKESWPPWLLRCTVPGVAYDRDDRAIVSLAVTPKATNRGITFFEAVVDPRTAEVEVLIDDDPVALTGKELRGF